MWDIYLCLIWQHITINGIPSAEIKRSGILSEAIQAVNGVV